MAFNPADYHARWQAWTHDPLVAQAGISFDRRSAGPIAAPPGYFRICAYHIDRDERPTCFLDVTDIEEARFICANLAGCCGQWNVDVAGIFDEKGPIA